MGKYFKLILMHKFVFLLNFNVENILKWQAELTETKFCIRIMRPWANLRLLYTMN